MIKLVSTLFAGLLLAGCASPLPRDIGVPPPGAPAVAQVLAEPGRYMGARVRWGGTIAAVENHRTETWVEVVARDLQGDGRPLEHGRSQGRFMARFQGFVDPVVYARGRALTVAGVVEGRFTKTIGDYPYRFPVVRVQSSYLWQPLPEPRVYDYPPPWYYDPWYWRPYYYPYSPPWWPRR